MMWTMPPPKKGSDHRDVLSGLPRSRPQRPSARREKARAAATGAAPSSAPAQPPEAAQEPKAAPKPKASAGRKAPARPKAAPKAKAPAAGYATPAPPRREEESGVLSTAIQAAGEIVQIGATVGGQALRSALRRIPRP